MKKSHLVTATLIIFCGALFRFLPHPPNFAPIAAMALFAGAYMDKKYAFFIPFIAMFVSDIFLGFHNTMPFVYVSFFLVGVLGMMLKKHSKPQMVIAAAFVSSLLFFVITNIGVWLSSGLYEQNTKGLAEAFVLAIPFFKNTLMGDLLFTSAFFALFEFFKATLLKERLLHEKASQPKS